MYQLLIAFGVICIMAFCIRMIISIFYVFKRREISKSLRIWNAIEIVITVFTMIVLIVNYYKTH